MTQLQHNLIAGIILVIIHKIAFHLFLKHHPVTQKNMKEWSDIIDDFLRKF